MTLLDDLSGYEFEDAVASLFRARGYEDVAVTSRVADEGRDITMRDGEVGYVVECKHTDTVSRPTVQKLHSAVATYDHDGPSHGVVVTSGRFTGAAETYAEELRDRDAPHPVELVDGDDLRKLGESVGMDLYNGRIEVVESAPSRAELPAPDIGVVYRPVVDVEAVTRATFETSVGVIHRVDRRDHVVLEADREGPELAPDLLELVGVETVELAAAELLCSALTTTVTYTGDNNVTYERECRPSPNDVHLGRVRADDVRRCVYCGASGRRRTPTVGTAAASVATPTRKPIG